MKICLVGPTYPFRGGISHYSTVLYTELARRHEVQFVSLRSQYPRFLFPGTTQIDSSREIIAVPNDPLLSPLNPLSWFRAAGAIQALRPELVLFQWWQPFFAPCFGTVARLLRAQRIPAAFLCHNVKAHESSAIDGILSRFALGAGAGFITHSAIDRDNLLRLLPRARVEVAPHPSYDIFRSNGIVAKREARKKLNLPDGDVALFFGNIRRYKGLPVLLRALREVIERRHCHLLVAGEFYHDEQEVRRLIDELGIGRHLTLVDRYVPNEDVGIYFAAADVVVLPYLSASQSGVAQIAFAFQRPVIASEVGGLPEVVEHETTGVVVPPNDPRSLARSLTRFFEEKMGRWMGANILARHHLFSWDRMVTTIECLASGEPLPDFVTDPVEEERRAA